MTARIPVASLGSLLPAALLGGIVGCSLLTPSVDDLAGGTGPATTLEASVGDTGSKDQALDVLAESSDTKGDQAPLDALIEAGIDGACATGQKNCSNVCVSVSDPSYGCEGDACIPCASLPQAAATCQGGQCALGVCNTNWGDCDKVTANGCETNLLTNQAHCGQCAHPCETGTQACVNGKCAITNCPSGTGDCDQDAANGCEVDLATDVAHCGACNQPCGPDHAQATCENGSCKIAACTAPYQDCNGAVADGCEANLTAEADHCGNCTTVCGSGPNGIGACANGSCTLNCNKGFGDCDGAVGNGCEVDTLKDPSHCNTCGHSCTGAPQADPLCGGGLCGFACKADWGDCNALASDGCEADLLTDVAHCGSCTTPCVPAHATGSCALSLCAVASCDSGWVDCDAVAANGCESDPLSDPLNCSQCGTVCPAPANAVGECTAGVCTGHHCNTGYSDCDSNDSNGCEINLQNDAANCGQCGHSCAGTLCLLGKCEVVTLATVTGAKRLALDDQYVFLLSDSAVYRASKSGGATMTLATMPTDMKGYGLAIDATAVYWSENSGNAFQCNLKRIDKNGTGLPQVLETEQCTPTGQPVAVDDQRVYYGIATGSPECCLLRAVNKTGGGAGCWYDNSCAGNESDVASLGLDDTTVYFSTGAYVPSDGRVRKRAKSGGTISVIQNGLVIKLLAVDSTDLFTVGNKTIWRIPKAGGTAVNVVSSDANGLAIDADRIYWTISDSVLALPKSGGAPVTLASGQKSPLAIAVDAAFVYWTTTDGVARVAK